MHFNPDWPSIRDQMRPPKRQAKARAPIPDASSSPDRKAWAVAVPFLVLPVGGFAVLVVLTQSDEAPEVSATVAPPPPDAAPPSAFDQSWIAASKPSAASAFDLFAAEPTTKEPDMEPSGAKPASLQKFLFSPPPDKTIQPAGRLKRAPKPDKPAAAPSSEPGSLQPSEPAALCTLRPNITLDLLGTSYIEAGDSILTTWYIREPLCGSNYTLTLRYRQEVLTVTGLTARSGQVVCADFSEMFIEPTSTTRAVLITSRYEELRPCSMDYYRTQSPSAKTSSQSIWVERLSQSPKAPTDGQPRPTKETLKQPTDCIAWFEPCTQQRHEQ